MVEKRNWNGNFIQKSKQNRLFYLNSQLSRLITNAKDNEKCKDPL